MKITYINEMTGEEIVEYIEIEAVEMEGVTEEQISDYANYREMLDAQIASGGRNQKNWLDISYLATKLQIFIGDNVEKYKRVYEAWKNQKMTFTEQPKRYFVVTGFEDEYGWLLETGSKKWFNLDQEEVEVFNMLGNGFSPEIYKASDLTEISKSDYDKLMQVHIDSAEEGWGAEEDEKFQALLNEIVKGSQDTWVEFENEETGCKVTARTFTIEGERRTVVMDNFSDFPFSIQNFDLNGFEVEEDWSNLFENPHVELVHGQHQILEKYLSPEDWKLVVMQLEWEYGLEVSNWDYDNQVPMQRTMTKLARVKLFERYNDLLMKSLKEGLDSEENTEYYMLYDELSLKEGENIYNLMKEMYEVRGVAQ